MPFFTIQCLINASWKVNQMFWIEEMIRVASGLTEFYQLIDSLNLSITFREVSKLLKILITASMTTAESERCFFTLKRISFLRSTTGNKRLSALAMLSIESPLVAETKNFNKKSYGSFFNLEEQKNEIYFFVILTWLMSQKCERIEICYFCWANYVATC